MTYTPSFYDPDRIGTLFYPDMAQIAAEAEKADLAPASLDQKKVHLIIIDMQVDFCHEAGALFVPGAPGDVQRLIQFIHKYAAFISKITCTLDSHLPFQIFHPSWWVDANGSPPEPLTIITLADIKKGKWQPVVMREYSVDYVQKLQEQAKKELVIWPYHVLIGSPGNQLDPALHATVIWHSLARRTQPTWLPKGMIPQTEHYSAIQPEIPVDNQSQGGKNEAFLNSLKEADIVLVAGEAESHCVLETLEDIVEEFRTERQQLEKIFVLQDCMSPVVHPDVDFHAMAMTQFEKMREAGVHFLDSTDPMPFLDAVSQQ